MEEDLETLVIRNWRKMAVDRDERRPRLFKDQEEHESNKKIFVNKKRFCIIQDYPPFSSMIWRYAREILEFW